MRLAWWMNLVTLDTAEEPTVIWHRTLFQLRCGGQSKEIKGQGKQRTHAQQPCQSVGAGPHGGVKQKRHGRIHAFSHLTEASRNTKQAKKGEQDRKEIWRSGIKVSFQRSKSKLISKVKWWTSWRNTCSGVLASLKTQLGYVNMLLF